MVGRPRMRLRGGDASASGMHAAGSVPLLAGVLGRGTTPGGPAWCRVAPPCVRRGTLFLAAGYSVGSRGLGLGMGLFKGYLTIGVDVRPPNSMAIYACRMAMLVGASSIAASFRSL